MADRHDADDLLIAAVAGGKTLTAAAAEAGVSERTARRRAKGDGFRAAVASARAGMVAAAAGRLAGNMTLAADALVALLADPDSGVKLRAAVKVIELGLRAAEVVDLERRVQELEAAGGDSDAGGDDGGD